MTIPADYVERVYAGVLGKIIGVYLGRPFEGWSFERIMAELGEIWYYVHEQRGVPLVVTDDDISGTFTFIRSLEDAAFPAEITPRQIGETWLNYLIEKRTILWWGGVGNSTEHTAYIRLKNGIQAPQSGSRALNGPIVSEQIGAQIFIDGWAMVSPGDPERAAELARRAGSVSHDGEALYGAQSLAAMEALAFTESKIDRLLDTAMRVIPGNSVIHGLIGDLRNWHAKDGAWRKTRERIVAKYGYHRYGGGCHIVPNHALIVLGLLYGEGDFQKSLMICNTSGWDTDCNSGNLGCLLGIRNGLAAFEGGPDWRNPVADRLYLPSADGGRCITDAVAETYALVNAARRMAGEELVVPKNGAKFHFSLPGSRQGFAAAQASSVILENALCGTGDGTRSLSIQYPPTGIDSPQRVSTPTFFAPEAMQMPGYELVGSPTLYSGQVIKARVTADGDNPCAVDARLFVRFYNGEDRLASLGSEVHIFQPGASAELRWVVPDTQGGPIAEVGLEILRSPEGGKVFLDFLTWDGAPRARFFKPLVEPEFPRANAWRKAWVNGVESWEQWGAAFRLVQNSGRGLLSIGTRDWQDYRVRATVTPALIQAGGIAARAQGMRRYYALLLTDSGKAKLVKVLNDLEISLAEMDYSYEVWKPVELEIDVQGSKIRGRVDGSLLEAADSDFAAGGAGWVVEVGHLLADEMTVEPV